MLRFFLVFFLSFSVGLIALADSYSDWDCPDLENSFDVGQTKFSFESWTWEEDGRFNQCNCVRNDGDGRLFVDWSDTGIRNIIDGNATNFRRSSYSTNGFREVSSALWYGRRPNKLEATSLIYDPGVQIPSGSIQSHARFSVPVSDKLPDFQNLHELVDNETVSIAQVELFFYSDFTADGGRVFTQCDYQVEEGQNFLFDKGYAIAFGDPILNLTMFGNVNGILLTKGFEENGFVGSEARSLETDGSGNFTISAETSLISFASFQDIQKTTLMVTAGIGGPVLATTPIDYFSTEIRD